MLVASISKTYNPHSIKLDLIVESFGHSCPVIIGLRVGEIGEHYISWPDLNILYNSCMIQRFPLIFCSSYILFTISFYSTEHLILYVIYEFFHLANQRNSFAVFDPDVHLGSYIIGRVRGRTLLITNSRILIPYIEWKLIKYSKTNLPKFTFLMKKFLKRKKLSENIF